MQPFHQGKSPKTQIVSHWQSGHFWIHFYILCHLALFFLPSPCCCCSAAVPGQVLVWLFLPKCFRELRCPVNQMGSSRLLDVIWVCSAHQTRVRMCPWQLWPLVHGREPQGLLSASTFSEVTWTPKGRQGYMCPFLWVYNSLNQGVTEKEGGRAWSLKVPLCTAGNSLGVTLHSSPGCRCFQHLPRMLRKICWVWDPGQPQLLSSGLSCGLSLWVKDGAGCLHSGVQGQSPPKMQPHPWQSTAPLRKHEQPSRKWHFKKL